MKLICNNAIYIEEEDLDFIGVIPRYLELPEINIYSPFIRFDGDNAIKFLRENEGIIDYYSVCDLSETELDEKINDVYKKLDRLSSMWLNSSTTGRKTLDRNSDFNSKMKTYKYMFATLKKYKQNPSYYKEQFENIKENKTEKFNTKILQLL